MEVLDGRGTVALWDGLRGAVLQRSLKDQTKQGADSGSGASPAGHRSLAQALEGLLTGGPDVPHIRTGGTERAGGAALGEELPPVAHPSNSPEVGHPGSAR